METLPRILLVTTTFTLVSLLLLILFLHSELSKNYGEDVIGLLNIQIAEAALTRDTEWVGKMDPFVTFDVDGQQVHKTATKDDAGKEPVWNEEVQTLEVRDLGTAVKYTVFDEDNFSSDEVGAHSVTLQEFCQEPEAELWMEIFSGGSSAGKVKFISTFSNFKEVRELEIDRLAQEAAA